MPLLPIKPLPFLMAVFEVLLIFALGLAVSILGCNACLAQMEWPTYAIEHPEEDLVERELRLMQLRGNDGVDRSPSRNVPPQLMEAPSEPPCTSGAAGERNEPKSKQTTHYRDSGTILLPSAYFEQMAKEPTPPSVLKQPTPAPAKREGDPNYNFTTDEMRAIMGEAGPEFDKDYGGPYKHGTGKYGDRFLTDADKRKLAEAEATPAPLSARERAMLNESIRKLEERIKSLELYIDKYVPGPSKPWAPQRIGPPSDRPLIRSRK